MFRLWEPVPHGLLQVWAMLRASHLFLNRLIGLVVRASASRAEGPGFKSRLCRDFSGFESYHWLKNWHSSGYPARPGVIGSVLGLVGPVSVYCDWVRLKVWPATSISVWQHVQLSEQVRPWDTLTCWWDVKQPPTHPPIPWCVAGQCADSQQNPAPSGRAANQAAIHGGCQGMAGATP